MNYIDLVLGILLIIAAFRGFFNGFVAEVASLAALILGVWGAIHFSHMTADFIVETFNYHSGHLGLVAFLITFVIIVILVHLVGRAVESIVTVAALGFINRLAGILFGLIKSALILSVVLLIFDEVDENVGILPADVKEESQMYEPVRNLVPTVLPFLKFDAVDNDLFERKKQRDGKAKKMV